MADFKVEDTAFFPGPGFANAEEKMEKEKTATTISCFIQSILVIQLMDAQFSAIAQMQ
jgi:hypothetical protein